MRDVGGIITGRALLDGQPLPYYGACLLREGCSPFNSVPTEVRADDGRFALATSASGNWRIALMGPGTRLKVIDVHTDHGQHAEVGDVVLERGLRIRGHVRDRSGAPVAGAQVIIKHRSLWAADTVLARSFMAHYEATTNAEGAYVFDGIDTQIEPMVLPQIWATHPTIGASVMRVAPVGDATLDFVLLGSARIHGVVEGFRGVHISALALRHDEPPKTRTANVDESGHFRFTDVPPGDYLIRLDTPEAEQVSTANVSVAADKTVRVKLVMQSGNVRVLVRVRPRPGRPLFFKPVSVGARIGDTVQRSMNLGPEEVFTWDYVRPGDYRLSIDGLTWIGITVAASPAEQTIDLRHVV